MRSKLCKNTNSLLRLEVGNCPLKSVIRSRSRLFCFFGTIHCGELLSVSYHGKFILVGGATQRWLSPDLFHTKNDLAFDILMFICVF